MTDQAQQTAATPTGAASVLDDELEGISPPECWYIDFGRYGQITMRQDEAQRASDAGAKVWKYATATKVPANVEVTGSPALSASQCGLPGYAGDNNGE